MVRSIHVHKKPRDDPLQDKPINFPEFDNLHLELIENKKKVKPGLPLDPVPERRKPPKPKKDPEPVVAKKKEKTQKQPKPEKPKSSKKREVEISDEEEEELVLEIGDEDDEEVAIEDEIGEDEEEEVDIDEIDESDDEEEQEDEDDPYAGLSPAEREAKEREEYIWRFRILKKQYKNADLPVYNEHSDLQMMKTSYDRTIRELYLDDAVESYRTYLMCGFMAMEFACTQWIGVDLSGFTIQQGQMMYKYERMLIELGEKSYNTWNTNLPVEIRLIGMILLQAGIFYVGKIISTNAGGNFAELFKSFTGQPPTPEPVNSEQGSPLPPKKKRMRGPKIRPEDIRGAST